MGNMHVLIGLETLQMPRNKSAFLYSNDQKHSPEGDSLCILDYAINITQH